MRQVRQEHEGDAEDRGEYLLLDGGEKKVRIIIVSMPFFQLCAGLRERLPPLQVMVKTSDGQYEEREDLEDKAKKFYLGEVSFRYSSVMNGVFGREEQPKKSFSFTKFC